jgi:hypothetical protein
MIAFELMRFLAVEYPARPIGALRPDIVLPEHTVVVEYDGYMMHRNTPVRDQRKTLELKRAGFDVIRIRTSRAGKSLPSVGEHDVWVSDGHVKEAVIAVLQKLSTAFNAQIAEIEEYRAADDLWNYDRADLYIGEFIVENYGRSGLKRCSACGQVKPSEWFGWARRGSGRQRSQCFACRRKGSGSTRPALRDGRVRQPRQRIKDLSTGVEFESIAKAAAAHGLSRRALSSATERGRGRWGEMEWLRLP